MQQFLVHDLSGKDICLSQNKTRHVGEQLVQSGLGVFSSVLGTVVIFILIARSLGPADFGAFALSYAAASLAGILFDFGYPPRLLRDTEQMVARWGGLPARVLHVKTLLLGVGTPVLLLAGWSAGLDLRILAAVWTGIALLSAANVFAAMLRARNRHGRDAMNQFKANALGALLAFGLSVLSPPPLAFALVFPVIGAAYLALTLRTWRQRFVLVSERIALASIGAETRASLAYLLDTFTQRGFNFLDVTIFAAVSSPFQVGLYQAGQKISMGVGLAAQPFNNVMLPRLSRLAATPEHWRVEANRFFILQAGVGAAAFALMAGIGPFIIGLLYTPDYAPVRSYMWLFGALVAARYVQSSLGIMVTSLGLQKHRSIINASSLALFATAAPILASLLNERGMILAALIASMSSSIGLFVLLTSRMRRDQS